MNRTSLGARAAWAAIASAGVAAAVAAIGSSVFADALVLQATDRRLEAAAIELLHEVESRSPARPLAAVVAEEEDEARASGMSFAVYGSGGTLAAGDRNIELSEGCRTTRALRVCGKRAPGGHVVVASVAHESNVGLHVAAMLVATALAAGAAWAIARRLVRRAVAPLERLRARIGDTAAAIELGDDEGVVEVDELRAALKLAMSTMQESAARSARFAANAAHELRTPLTALRGELELMAEDASGRSPESVETALRKVDQLHALTERLLVLATPEERRLTFELLSLRDLIDDVAGDLPESERARLTIEEDADVFVRGDAAALRMVVSNGLSNALKFASDVAIRLRRDHEFAVVAIDDDGPGVKPEDRARVFEPFVRAASGRAPGHGIGLALVAHVARWHSGNARLTDSPAGGARLELRLPAVSSSD